MKAKTATSAPKRKATPTESIAAVCAGLTERLAAGKRVRRDVLDGGRLFVDRLLPFMVLYRGPADNTDAGTPDLATTCAAYLLTTNEKRHSSAVLEIVNTVRKAATEQFGAFLLIEIWARPPEHPPIATREEGARDPGFRLFATPESAEADVVLEVLSKHLSRVKSTGRVATVEIPNNTRDFPRRVRPIYRKTIPDVLQIGIEVEPSYRDLDATTVFPAVVRTLRAGIDRALRQATFRFAHRQSKHRPANFNALGRRALVKVVWEVDAKLDAMSNSFDFLLAVTPINLGQLSAGFRKSNYEHLPSMRYRPLPIDPAQAKRELFSIPIERIEDPTLVSLFSEKQDELDRQLTMLHDRGTERFMLGGQQLYGRISPELVRAAEDLLERVPATRSMGRAGRSLSPEELVTRGREEIAYYRKQWDGVEAEVNAVPNVLAGIMVSKGNLLVASDAKIRENRADALMQHEVGTHLVTYYNGRAQRLSLLRSGLAGYEEMQEGLAVLAEYLVSGMTATRIRTLAARVLAAKAVIDGASFVDTFRMLCRYGFSRNGSFSIALRLYRGGGFIKDCVYLRGLTSVLDYLAEGRSFERLFVGKLALGHVRIVAELESRGVIVPPKLLPRYLERETCQRRLAALRKGRSIGDLLDETDDDDA